MHQYRHEGLHNLGQPPTGCLKLEPGQTMPLFHSISRREKLKSFQESFIKEHALNNVGSLVFIQGTFLDLAREMSLVDRRVRAPGTLLKTLKAQSDAAPAQCVRLVVELLTSPM